MTAEQLAQEAAPVITAADELVALAPQTGNSADLADDNMRAAATFKVAVRSWAGTQAQEVVSGARPYARWHKYGTELLRQIQDYSAEISQTGGWWQRMRDAIGRSADSATARLEAKVGALQAEVRSIGALRDAVNARLEFLRPRLSEVSDDVLDIYIESSDAATAAWRRLVDITDGLARAVGSLRSGELSLARGSGGDLLAVASTDGAENVLSGAPVVVGLLTAVAVAVALAVSVRAYYAHADEVTRAEVARQELELVAGGRGAEVLELRRLRTEADKARESGGGGTDPIALAGKVLAGGALALGGIWGLKLLAERFLFRGRAA